MADDAAPWDRNPLLRPWPGPLCAPPFDRVRTEDFLPAIDAAIEEHKREIEAIVADPDPPTFENSLAALERSGETLSRVRRLFWTLSSAQADDALRAIEPEVSARLTRHGSEIGQNAALFARIAEIWTRRERLGLAADQERLAEQSYKGFVRGGAALGPEEKARFAQIEERLAALSVQFGHNVLAAANAWEMWLEEADLAGLPQGARDAAARRAAKKDRSGVYLFTLDRGDVESFLTYSERRDLRERVWRAFIGRCDGGPHDNNPLIVEMLALRQESARLLGYPSFAEYKLEDSMAGTPDAAMELMMRVWPHARAQALREAALLQELVDADGGGFAVQGWDWRFYAERIRRERYAVDSARIAAHLTLDKVRDTAFAAAGRLYGLRFQPRADLPVYHPDVRPFEVAGDDGGPVGLLYTDYFARAEKHGGAWMGTLRVQEKMDGAVRPIVYTVANFAKAPAAAESSLSMDEARTLFHEFGHALHALLSDVTYPSQSGTAVARDFVELPSKFMEHWVTAPETLRGLGVDAATVEAFTRAETFGQGIATLEFLGSALVDLEIHRAKTPVVDPGQFEREMLARLGMPAEIPMRHRLPHFTHVFDGGYASAYYAYLWSEVLDADAFAAFTESGDLFDPGLARQFRDEILAPGDTRDPRTSFVKFRGRLPDEGPLLRARGLA